mmetsp:Transcript_4006/g.4356  ORF Transcript_4006/g.4356 Transcript_4006/m.4356 type:complete len:259 (-) Transcript_4006:41-817(-)
MRSILLAQITSERPSLTTASAMASSCRCNTPASASRTSTATSATLRARMASRTAMSSMSSPCLARLLDLRIPAVSTSWTGRSFQVQLTEMESRVRPGVAPVMTRSCFRRAFTRVDFPTLGRPRMVSWSGFSGPSSDSLGSNAGCDSTRSVSESACSACSRRRRFFFTRRSMTTAISAMPSPCSAEIGTGLPNPTLEISLRCSITGEASSSVQRSPSSLLARMSTCRADAVASSASTSSSKEMPLESSFRSHRMTSSKS